MSTIAKFASRRGTIYRALLRLFVECGSPAASFRPTHCHTAVLMWPILRAAKGGFPVLLLGVPGSLFEPGPFSFPLRRFLRILCTLCVSVSIPFLSFAQQPQLKIAAAADLKFAMTEIATAYEKQSGVKLNLTFGSSGNFFSQIQNGAPFDLFFSADSEYPRKLNETGLIVPNSAYEYA